MGHAGSKWRNPGVDPHPTQSHIFLVGNSRSPHVSPLRRPIPAPSRPMPALDPLDMSKGIITERAYNEIDAPLYTRFFF